MRKPRDRYQSDSDYKHLVDYMTAMIHKCQFTPSELREASVLASVIYEENRLVSSRVELDQMDVAKIHTLLNETSAMLDKMTEPVIDSRQCLDGSSTHMYMGEKRK